MIAPFLDTIWTLAAFVTALAVIVTVHEYGHYIVGRWSGIRAEVFSVGFGPRLISRRDRRGTLWQVAALPLGGYVRFLGDANAASAGTGQQVDPAMRRRTLHGAPLWARFATLLAGPVFNFILSILIFGGFAIVQGLPQAEPRVGSIAAAPPSVTNELQPGDRILAVGDIPVETWGDLGRASNALPLAPVQDWTVERDGQRMTVAGPDPMPARITGVAPRSAAVDAGLRGGDVVVAIDGAPVSRFDQLRQAVEAAGGQPIDLTVWREGQGRMDLTLTPRLSDLPAEGGGFEQRWLIGVTGGESFFTAETRRAGPLEALRIGVVQTWGIITSSLLGMWAMITGQIGTCNLGGAISIAESTGQAASAGGANFLWWIAVLSAAIGFLNLLPIPVLDGGHLMFYAYEAVAGRPPSDRVLNALTAMGMAIVLTLMIFGLTNDLLCP
ncbi:RIP metalloprotease RseP [Paracoccus sp. 1_MG-2023]|uniref:RIP metalloprotease RseP n=1 Tax=unclassified Paracoccus (in: a-proteobacteria) TaxID=2688777 RepID=UPI001C0A0161|nr:MULTISPECIES: RIP metalloprotease RseP [unclassified Paracoccus (in: a-proteobacteria)]MBU2958560.1 RIP metalloprotease RseP [Paracoccus sp. C2R09]MDO6667553.1 RIP metalloprotease RseP [Paracoccus sp. 1_MG-2023]